MRKIILAALAVTLASPALAIDFTAPLLNPDGIAYRRCVKPDQENPNQCARDGFVDQTLGAFIADALNVTDPGAKADGIVARGRLALKIRQAHDLDLSASERDLIKEAFTRAYAAGAASAVSIVQALSVIDPAALKDK